MRVKDAGLSLLLVFILFAVVIVAPAQVQSHQIALKGKVLDPARAPIAGALVTAIPDGKASGPSALSDQAGEFALPLEPGTYALKVTSEGFQESVQTIKVTSGSEFLSIGMQIEGQHDTVTIVATDYQTVTVSSATKTLSPLRDVPQSITVVTREQVRDQMMSSLGDVVRYVPGITAHQGENNRDQVIMRGIS